MIRADTRLAGGTNIARTSVIVLTSVLLAVASTAYGAGETPVLNSGHDEQTPAASDGYLLWVANSNDRPRHYDAFAKPDGQPRFRLNPAGTQSFSVGVDGTTAVYQRFTPRDFDSDIKMYDLEARERSSPPAGVNTDLWEQRPTTSGDWLLFQRQNFGNHPWARVVLFNTATEKRRILDQVTGNRRWLMSNQVNGDFATWERCDPGFAECEVYRYKISTKERMKIPNPGQQQYSSGVAEDGTVYFIRAGRSAYWVCGRNARIVRYADGGTEVIASIRDGRDSFATFAITNPDGSDTFYYDRVTCRDGAVDVYVVEDADTARPVAVRASREGPVGRSVADRRAVGYSAGS
ncbi:MAG TPA: hypothetical protein VJN50_03495 [Actinomycetota bacterium]|nr:hypothetical protein [Actinomycetota bacterium]